MQSDVDWQIVFSDFINKGLDPYRPNLDLIYQMPYHVNLASHCIDRPLPHEVSWIQQISQTPCMLGCHLQHTEDTYLANLRCTITLKGD
jgi:hypothetical protein